MVAPRSHANLLTGTYIDRATLLRKDAARVQAALHDPRTIFVPVWRDQSLVRSTNSGLGALLVSELHRFVRIEADELVLLGEYQQRTCFALALTSAELPSFGEPAQASDLRTIAGELPSAEAGLLAYARAMVHWRARHRFCGRCGNTMTPTQAGHVLICSASECAHQEFPRIDPAIIVLITHGDRVLLGRQASWPQGRYSTIAGFVEPGESLEDAVAREVAEETGVQVDSVEYHSSQPWPFPSSLMLGFMARASSTEVRLADAELEDAQWVTRSDIATGAIGLPLTHSISFRLIEDWYDAEARTPLRQEPGVKMMRSAKR